MSEKTEKQFNDAELQVIERMAMAFELAVLEDDPKRSLIETKRAIALIYAKRKPAEFIRNIIKKAGKYVDRTSVSLGEEE